MDGECTADHIREVFAASFTDVRRDAQHVIARVDGGVPFEDLGLDSLDVWDFVLRLEDRWHVKIKAEELVSLQDFPAVAAFVNRCRSLERSNGTDGAPSEAGHR